MAFAVFPFVIFYRFAHLFLSHILMCCSLLKCCILHLISAAKVLLNCTFPRWKSLCWALHFPSWQKAVPTKQRCPRYGCHACWSDSLAGRTHRGRTRDDLQGLRHPYGHPRPNTPHHQRPGGTRLYYNIYQKETILFFYDEVCFNHMDEIIYILNIVNQVPNSREAQLKICWKV